MSELRENRRLSSEASRSSAKCPRTPSRCADSRSSVTEAFRALRTNLQYLLARRAERDLVSSLHPQEGKSFVSANLASILAKAGKRWRSSTSTCTNPRYTRTWAWKTSGGRRRCSLARPADVIQKAFTALWTSSLLGHSAQRVRLILSDRMALVANLKAQYDYVILDTPPTCLSATRWS